MERLTLAHYGGNGHYMRCSERYGCIGDCGACEELDELVERLAFYEDLEERGRLVVSPCGVGEAVWFIRPTDYKKEITETAVEKVVVKAGGIYIKLACNAMYETYIKAIGKSVFLSREEAENARKRRR